MQDIINEFQKEGTINLDIFKWVRNDKELMTILDEEYRMYDYHTRLIDSKSNRGWCRTMYHSLFQQLIRGDIYYYTCYMVLRRAVYLISYPYYTKFAKPGDKTRFRHVDINLGQAALRQGNEEMIQGSVSWDDEDPTNCTPILTRFHHHLAEYQQWRVAKGMDKKGAIEAWQDNVDWPQELRSRWPEVRWVNTICKPGMVRISDPRLPHGSNGPATKIRRTMLPWFVRVNDDMETMEFEPMGTYDQLAKAHRNLTAGPKSPSGHPNMYGGISIPFAGATPPVFTSKISQAIHCQILWNSPGVLLELLNLFGPNGTKDGYWDFVTARRKEVAKSVKERWIVCKKFEMAAFGDNSFWRKKGPQSSQRDTKTSLVEELMKELNTSDFAG
ncbi:hypothetical protein EJ04DRAFT_530260 [Polyplosphaeria fusca]|uniref:Uncharacterized protein n=1 Tax=Polyplosphaeria fusca TaxID=682080 RepID=A0A9P4QKJ9_9PLEO|nr:hypothetical protein EJ04DRAFT_530260 [Polyplosphaeria fusca]